MPKRSMLCANTVEKRRSYSELIEIPTIKERFEYLKIGGKIGDATFGSKRIMNQLLYHSDKWRKRRDKIIIRDNGCEMAFPDHEILYMLTVHHLNPITLEDVLEERDCVFDPENLVCVSGDLHKAIHYASDYEFETLVERKPFDTCPWREV